jgi:hypothetical protein
VRYKVHRFDLSMTRDQFELEEFLNGLEGEVISVLPNLTWGVFNAATVNFVLVVERVHEDWFPRRDKGERIPEDIAVP